MLQNAAPTFLGTHEYSRAHFLILGSGLLGVGVWDPPAQLLISGSANQGRFYGGRSRGGYFPKIWPLLNRVGAEFIGVTRKERPCFAAERGLDRLGYTSLRMDYWGHTKGTALCCFAAECGPDPFGHTRVFEGLFSDLWIRAPRCRGLGSSSPAPHFGICKSRPDFQWPISGGILSQNMASTKSSWGRIYWSHTKRTALFCCRTWS